MIKKTKTIKYYSDLDGALLNSTLQLETEGKEMLGAVINFNSNYGGICDGEQSQYVIPEWLAKEFFERINEIKKNVWNKQ